MKAFQPLFFEECKQQLQRKKQELIAGAGSGKEGSGKDSSSGSLWVGTKAANEHELAQLKKMEDRIKTKV